MFGFLDCPDPSPSTSFPFHMVWRDFASENCSNHLLTPFPSFSRSHLFSLQIVMLGTFPMLSTLIDIEYLHKFRHKEIVSKIRNPARMRLLLIGGTQMTLSQCNHCHCASCNTQKSLIYLIVAQGIFKYSLCHHTTWTFSVQEQLSPESDPDSPSCLPCGSQSLVWLLAFLFFFFTLRFILSLFSFLFICAITAGLRPLFNSSFYFPGIQSKYTLIYLSSNKLHLWCCRYLYPTSYVGCMASDMVPIFLFSPPIFGKKVTAGVSSSVFLYSFVPDFIHARCLIIHSFCQDCLFVYLILKADFLLL